MPGGAEHAALIAIQDQMRGRAAARSLTAAALFDACAKCG
jgi:hypothetical protein